MDPFASALEQAAAVARREVSALELVDGYLDRIERLGPALNAFWVVSAERAREQARDLPVGFWDDHDVLLTPTLTRPPFEVGHLGGDPEAAMREALDWLHFTYPYNCTGQPAISLPLGRSGDGLPLGVQVVGGPRREGAMLGVAGQLEACLPWGGRRPEGW
jgi:amidase